MAPAPRRAVMSNPQIRWPIMTCACGPPIPFSPLLHQIRRDAGGGDLDRQDHPLVVERERIDAHDAMIAIGIAEWTAVVNDVPLAGPLGMQHRVVTGARRHRGILLQDLADPLEWTER